MSTRLKKVETFVNGFYNPSHLRLGSIHWYLWLRCGVTRALNLNLAATKQRDATIREAVPYRHLTTMAAECCGIWRLPESWEESWGGFIGQNENLFHRIFFSTNHLYFVKVWNPTCSIWEKLTGYCCVLMNMVIQRESINKTLIVQRKINNLIV